MGGALDIYARADAAVQAGSRLRVWTACPGFFQARATHGARIPEAVQHYVSSVFTLTFTLVKNKCCLQSYQAEKRNRELSWLKS